MTALLGAYLALPQWVPLLMKTAAKDAGFELTSVEMKRPDWELLQIDEMVLRYDANGYQASLYLTELSVSYTWQGLFKGLVNNIDIAKASVNVTTTKALSNRSSADEISIQPTDYLPSILFPQLPFSKLNIEQLKIQLPHEYELEPLTGQFAYHMEKLQFDLVSAVPEKGNSPELTAQLELNQSNRIKLDFQHNAEPVFQINSQIEGQQLIGELSLNLQSGSSLIQQLGLMSVDDQLSGEAKLSWQMPLSEEIVTSDWAITVDFQSDLMIDTFALDGLRLKGLNYVAAGRATLSTEMTQIQFTGANELKVGGLRAPDLDITNLLVKLPQSFEVSWTPDQLTVPEFNAELPATQLRWQKEPYHIKSAQFQLRDVRLDMENPQQRRADINLSLQGLEVLTGDLQIQPLDLQGDWQLENDELSGTVEVADAADILRIQGEMRHNLQSGKGRVDSTLEKLSFLKTERYLPRLFTNWPFPVDLFAGDVTMNTTLTWNDSEQHVTGQIKLNDISGFYDTNLFRGLNTEIQVGGALDSPVLSAKQLHIDQVDAGFPINNIQLGLRATIETIQIHDFQAELLGGKVGQRLVSYDFTQDENELLIQVSGVQLNELLNLETGVEGLGVLDGKLPIRITPAGISMPLGEIKARTPGGFIKYQGAKAMGDAVADVGVGFALEALENFHFEQLDVKARYQEDGQLRLETTLLGRNPDMSEKRPVRYNINIQENIPALIASLKLTQQISEDIERRIQAFYKERD